ncbi:Na+/H+ antiporter NhaA [Leifsonia sp. A12D58]|uniref:Na+/H+ antiporter NhaA n=1 Tax=Leifsonia sp. A12D58 TaxID=3397674 RepID=UPI0039E194B8
MSTPDVSEGRRPPRFPSLRRFLPSRTGIANSEKTAAALLLLFTVAAIVWANSPWADTYQEFWGATVDLRVGDVSLELTFRELVNDALMAFFFFTVGLEVKHEFVVGELTDRSRALVPVVAAVAGLLVPAGIFLLINPTGENAHAWGVVISTDTAFLVGALALVGPKFPARLRVFLLTLAVVDDIGALAAIAIFYTDNLQLTPMIVAVCLLALIALVRYLPVGSGPAYTILAVALWFALYAAHIHPTLAGVAVALLIPAYPPRRSAVERSLELAQAFRQSPNPSYAQAATKGLRDSLSINDRLQAAYAPYITFLVLPIFALANAGVRLDEATLSAALTSPLSWGIVAGLVLGKFIGITGATLGLRALGLGTLAPGLNLSRVAGGAALSGIGFTIALFIVEIAIPDPELQDEARVGVLTASVIALILGWAIFRITDRLNPPMAIGGTLARPVDPARDHIRGNQDAPLTLVEYGDFECPFCSRATGTIDEVREHFGSELRYVWRHLPLDRVHPHAIESARASEAAALQGKFFEFAPVMFANQDHLEFDDLVRYAAGVGLDVDRFIDDMRSARVVNRVQDDVLDAEFMDLHSTPTFFIGEARHHGPYDAPVLIRALTDFRERNDDGEAGTGTGTGTIV